MSTSQNGWTVITSQDLDKSVFPGTNIVPVPGVRKGDAAIVLHYVGSQFNKNVEKLVNPGCWGYFNRTIIGSSQTSNHASGTAIDLNAPKHPLGASGTFTATQKAAIRKILDYCGGVVRWGGDYSGRKDEMHFEINAGSAKVSALAKKIKNDTLNVMTDKQLHDIGTYARRAVNHREPASSKGAIVTGKKFTSSGKLTPKSVIAGFQALMKEVEWERQGVAIKSGSTTLNKFKTLAKSAIDKITG